MAITALLPAARALATKVASNPEVQAFGKGLLQKTAGIAVDAVAERLKRGVAAPEGLVRRPGPAATLSARQEGTASPMRRSNATNALAMMKAARQESSIVAQSALPASPHEGQGSIDDEA